jgi:hypothetical protein
MRGLGRDADRNAATSQADFLLRASSRGVDRKSVTSSAGVLLRGPDRDTDRDAAISSTDVKMRGPGRDADRNAAAFERTLYCESTQPRRPPRLRRYFSRRPAARTSPRRRP